MGTKSVIQTKDVASGDDLIGNINAANEVLYEEPEIEVTAKFLAPGTPGGDAYLKEMKFMEETVGFIIGETSDPTAEPEVPVSVNCVTKTLKRGVEYKLPRKFINALIARKGTVTVENYKDKDNIDQTRTRTKFTPVHNISITYDPSGEFGLKWYKWQSENA